MAAPQFFVRLALAFASAILLLVESSLSQTLQPAQEMFHSWRVTSLAHRPNSSTVYLVDNSEWLRGIDSTTGSVLPLNVSVVGPPRNEWTRVAVDRSGDKMYVLQRRDRSETYTGQYNWTLLTMTPDLKQQLTNISINHALNPPLTPNSNVYGPPLIGPAGTVYVVRRQSNNSMLVNVVSPAGKQTDLWQQSWPTSVAYSYRVAVGPDDTRALYFLSAIQTGQYGIMPLFINTRDGTLHKSLILNLTVYDCYDTVNIVGFAVSSDGTIAVASPYCVMLFRDDGSRVPFNIEYGYGNYRVLYFLDTTRLLTVVSPGDGIEVVSAKTGNVLTEWTNNVPDLNDVGRLAFDQRSQSLVVGIDFQGMFDDDVVHAMRLDADHGTLLQQYQLPARLSRRCYEYDSDAGIDIYLLLSCSRPAGYKLITVNYAGQLRREVTLPSWVGWLQFALHVDERLSQFFVLTTDPQQAKVNRLLAFSFDGTSLLNFSDPRIGNIDERFVSQGVTRYVRTTISHVNQTTVAVTDPSNHRIVLLDINTGAFISNITLANNTVPVAAYHDGEHWYRSEATLAGTRLNSSLMQYAMDGSVVAQYALDNQGSGTETPFSALAVDSARHRLYAIKSGYGIAMWTLSHNATSADVPVVQASSVRAERGDRWIRGAKTRRSTDDSWLPIEIPANCE